MKNITKQDLLQNIAGTFGLLCSAPTIQLDEDVINAAGKFILILSPLNY